MDASGATEDAIFKVGKVVSVDGRMVRVSVDKTKNTSHLMYRGRLLKNISVGGYVKIAKGFAAIIGKVDGEFVVEDKEYRNQEYGSDREKVSRTLTVSLLGFFKDGEFVRGIKEMPLIENECFLLRADEFAQVHNFLEPGDVPITLGTLALEGGQEVNVGINGLFASHIGVFGNTGSGKSYTLARIYHELFALYKDVPGFVEKAEFLLIDFNGEYVGKDGQDDDIIVEKKYKNIYRLSTKNQNGSRIPVDSAELNDAEFWAVFLEATEKTQKPFLRRAIESPFLQSRIEGQGPFRGYLSSLVATAVASNDRNLEKGVLLNLFEQVGQCPHGNQSIEDLLDDYRENLQFNGTTRQWYYSDAGVARYLSAADNRETFVEAKIDALEVPLGGLSSIDQVRLRVTLQYYDDIIKGFSNREHLAPVMKRMDKRIEDLKKVVEVEDGEVEGVRRNFTVVSLKETNVHIRKIIPLLLCKRLYEAKKRQNDGSRFLNLIIDEAHNILSEQSDRESEQWKDYRLEIFEEIIKEGRKFGVFVTVASQRPYDISPTIISQLHNYFLHRLINNQDIKAIERTVSYLDKVSFEALPILPTGTCVFAGLLANVPVVVDIGMIKGKFEPRNKTMTLVDQWK